MPDRILHHTWHIRTVSPFVIPLFSSEACKNLSAVEEQLTNFVRQKTAASSDSTEELGTYVTLAWIPVSPPSQRHLHIDIRLCDEPGAQVLLCFPTMDDTEAVTCVSFAMVRGSNTLCNAVFQWLESNCGCVFGNRPFAPTPDQVAHALAVWTAQQDSSNHNKPLEVVFAAPDAIASAGLSKLCLTVPPVALVRLLQDMKTNNTTAQKDLPILRALQCYILEAYQIHIENFSLVRASSAAATLGCDGRCKPVEGTLLASVLLELQSMIQSQLRIGMQEEEERETHVDTITE